MNLLPEKMQTAVLDYPQRLLLYSQPKAGKSTAVSLLDGVLLIDLEDGAKHIENVYTINVPKMLKENPSLDGIGAMRQIYMSLKTQAHNFKFLCIDTLDMLEIYAGKEIEQQEGRPYQDIEWGRGYAILREKLIGLIDAFYNLGLNIILIGHRKRSITGENERAVIVTELDLTGKNRNAIMAYVDAIGYLYREKDDQGNTVTTLNFYSDSTEHLEAGCRVRRLANRQIPLITMDKNMNVIGNNWHEIYPQIRVLKNVA